MNREGGEVGMTWKEGVMNKWWKKRRISRERGGVCYLFEVIFLEDVVKIEARRAGARDGLTRATRDVPENITK